MKAQDFLDLSYSLPGPMCLVSADGIVLAANPAATEMLGFDGRILSGKRLVELVTNPAERVTRYLKSCSRTRESVPGSLTWQTKGGEVLECRTNGAALPPTLDDTLPLVLLRFRPKEEQQSKFSCLNSELESLRAAHHRLMDQRDQLEERVLERTAELARHTIELERSNRELDQFAYVTSHDLKAPLRGISNLSEWIEEDIGEQSEEDTRKQMELLRGRVKRMEDLIDGILQYSRLGREAVDIKIVDTAELLAEIIDALVPPEDFTISIGPDMPVFETARVRLSQVFANLISNAIKYHDRLDGRVEVLIKDAGEYYEFTVTDDGPGIASEYHEKVFQIFQTLQAKDNRESTGVGLTLVKKIIEDQGGTISLESGAGEGATFRFTWPKCPVGETGQRSEATVGQHEKTGQSETVGSATQQNERMGIIRSM